MTPQIDIIEDILNTGNIFRHIGSKYEKTLIHIVWFTTKHFP